VREPFTADTPVGKLDMVNVYADIPGRPRTSGPAPMVILCSHYDTKRLDVPFVGANDGASSTGVLLELARVLVKDAPHRVAYRLLFLDGEEATRFTWVDPDNRYGSRHHAEGLQKSGEAARVKACIVIDMVGDKDLVLERDSYSDSHLFDAFVASAKDQGLERHFSTRGQPSPTTTCRSWRSTSRAAT
jgi:Zn-dependent M28 family amino/carboxypeptidase